jgi:hypothetical protein
VHLSGTLWDRMEFWNLLSSLQCFTLREWSTWNRGWSQNWRPPSESVWLAFLFFFLFYPCSYACCKVPLSPELCRRRTGVQGHDWKRWGRNSGKRSDLCRMAIRVFHTSSKLWSRRVIRSVPRFGPRILLLIAVALARWTTRGQQLHSLLCFFTRPPSPPPLLPTLSPPRNLDVVSWCFFLCFLSTVFGCSWLPRWYPCRKWIFTWLYWRRGFANFTVFSKRCIQFS